MKLWLNNTIEDRLYMLQKAAKDHPGINQLAIEKDLVGDGDLEGFV